jgi:hypothetical protein
VTRRIAIAALLLVVAWSLVGCRRKAPRPPVPPAKAPAAETPVQVAQAAKGVVVAYLNHLEKDEYKAAYALLTAKSQAEHPYAEFAEQAKKGGPLYDTDGATARAQGKDRVTVSVPMSEDPARVAFAVAKEGSEWRVVYHTGRPWTPYA